MNKLNVNTISYILYSPLFSEHHPVFLSSSYFFARLLQQLFLILYMLFYVLNVCTVLQQYKIVYYVIFIVHAGVAFSVFLSVHNWNYIRIWEHALIFLCSYLSRAAELKQHSKESILSSSEERRHS